MYEIIVIYPLPPFDHFRLGETCSHVGALLFKLETSVRLGYTSVAPTSIACAWNKVATKKVEGDRVHNITLYSDKAKNKAQSRRQRKGAAPVATQEQQDQFLHMLAATGENPVGLSTFKGFSEPFRPTPWFSSLSITEEQVEAIEEATRTQAQCAAWHEERVGRVTGTSAHRVLHTSKDAPSETLIRDILHRGTVHKQLRAPAIIWGREHEQEAVAMYTYALGLRESTASTTITLTDEIHKAHTSLNISQAGFRVSVDRPYIGVSCDAYVSCECCGRGVVEVKCPLKWVDVSPEHWPTDKTGHLDTLLTLRKDHSYYTQVIQCYREMYVIFSYHMMVNVVKIG